MPSYRCITCGKTFDPEKDEICPRCGTIVAPSVLAQIERKQTAARLRREAKENADPHCHEDDAWRGSSAAEAHRAQTAAWHESAARGANPYNPNQSAAQTPARSNPVRNVPTPAAQRSQKARKPKFPFLIPLIIIIMWIILFRILRVVNSITWGGFSYP